MEVEVKYQNKCYSVMKKNLIKLKNKIVVCCLSIVNMINFCLAMLTSIYTKKKNVI